MINNLTLLLWPILVIGNVSCNLQISTKSLEIATGDRLTFNITISAKLENVTDFLDIKLLAEDENVVYVLPNKFQVFAGNNTDKFINSTYTVEVEGLACGKSKVYVITGRESRYLLANVFKSKYIGIMSEVLKWVYVVAWSICYYPQMYTNFTRKSVVGLNFDFVLFGVFGYCMYTAFNFGLYFIPSIKGSYLGKSTESVMPVQACDIVSTAHNMILSTTVAIQCLMYEKGTQRISKTAIGMVLVFILGILLLSILALCEIVLWLDVLYGCSYVKLILSVVLYIPQVCMNFKRKCTSGWSVGGALLDLTGAIASSFQMLVDSYNYGTWEVILHNISKFGIGVVSGLFSTTLIVQHTMIYRTPAPIEKKIEAPRNGKERY